MGALLRSLSTQIKWEFIAITFKILGNIIGSWNNKVLFENASQGLSTLNYNIFKWKAKIFAHNLCTILCKIIVANLDPVTSIEILGSSPNSYQSPCRISHVLSYSQSIVYSFGLILSLLPQITCYNYVFIMLTVGHWSKSAISDAMRIRWTRNTQNSFLTAIWKITYSAWW